MKMKTPKATISAALQAEIDFGYIKEATGIQREFAVFYEYSRHSEEIVNTVDYCRMTGFFDCGSMPSFATLKNDAFFRHLARIAKVIPLRVLGFLADCPEFPEFPFGCAPKTERSSSQELLIRSPVDMSIMPLKAFQSLPAVINALNPSFHMLTIDWTYSTAEIVASFQRSIGDLRPAQFPEPKRAGQTGRSIGAGALVKLNQLAAYRLDSAGFGFDAGHELTEYTTAEGWEKAVVAAKHRIENITKLPIFKT